MVDESYDIKIHLPQQMENFFQSFATGDLDALNRSFGNICSIIKDPGFQKDVKEYDSNKQKQSKMLLDKAREAVKTAVETKNMEELYIDLDEIKNDLNMALSNLEGEYWEVMRKYVAGWITK